MPNLSKNFLVFSGRLFIAGIIVLGGFHFGSAFYIESIDDQPDKINVRSLTEEIDRLPTSNLNIYIQDDKKVIPTETIESWLESYTRNYSGKEDMRISPEKVEGYLASIATSINRQPVSARFTIVDGRAEEFVPSEYGRRLDLEASKGLIMSAVINGVTEVSLPVEFFEPEITLDKVNKLGITTLIGRGESDFKGSPVSRVHNIKVGSAKYNGTIIKPGEEFSFNDILGEVDEKSGYQPELVIKGGRLIYEYGGGICQVSTTLFRSVIMAGLSIAERRPHSFAVKYYDPQGFDATIYPGVVDLRFKNDTPNHILIQSRIEGTKLIFDMYGPADSRKTVLEGPFQYDQKANGAMKAYFVRKVYDGELLVKEDRFDSNYRPPVSFESNPLE